MLSAGTPMSRLARAALATALTLVPGVASPMSASATPTVLPMASCIRSAGSTMCSPWSASALFAARLGGRALWLVPLAFVAMMGVGGAIGMAGIGLPYGRDRHCHVRDRARPCRGAAAGHLPVRRRHGPRRALRRLPRPRPRRRDAGGRRRPELWRWLHAWRPRCCTALASRSA